MADMDVNSELWTKRSVLVTGATGLLGGWLVEALIGRGATVVCLVRDEVPRSRFRSEGLDGQVVVCRGDVSDQATLERILGEHEVRSVFHLAAQTIVGIANRNPVSTFQSNVAGTWALLEACRRSPLVSEIVVASSDKAYGDQVDFRTVNRHHSKADHTTSASRALTSSRKVTRPLGLARS